MKAMILAAGLGARLRPLTEAQPKALIEYQGAPLLEHVLTRLISFGVAEVIINLHHFPQQIIEFLNAKHNFGIRIEFSHEPVLLDTGGGLKQAAWFFDDGQPFLLHNVDILSDIDLNEMTKAHRSDERLATLAVKRRAASRYFLFDKTGQLCGWKSFLRSGSPARLPAPAGAGGVSEKNDRTILTREPEGKLQELAFCGIHVLSPSIFDKLTETGAFSIVESYLRLAGAGESIRAFRVDGCHWLDMGKLENLKNA
jgi:NDP-sugar pyrophosphorylase family protein